MTAGRRTLFDAQERPSSEVLGGKWYAIRRSTRTVDKLDVPPQRGMSLQPHRFVCLGAMEEWLAAVDLRGMGAVSGDSAVGAGKANPGDTDSEI